MLGDIILLNRKKGGWFSSAQRFFTQMNYTHSTFSIGTILGIESVLSADEKVVIEPLKKYFEEDGTEIEIWRINENIIDAKNKPLLEQKISEIYYKYSNSYYGFFQVIWFIYRWINEKFFKRDVRRKNNPFKRGIICSELVYYYLIELEKILNKTLKKGKIRFDVLLPLQAELSKYTPDTIHAGDIAQILNKNNKLFYKLN